MNKNIEKAFSILPRNGAEKDAVWVPRPEEERRLRDIFKKKTGKSICLDGPTGTGKSSIAITSVFETRKHFLRIQLVRAMDWLEFSQIFLEIVGNKRIASTYTHKFGVIKLLPKYEFSKTVGPDRENIYRIVDSEYTSKNFNLHDLALILSRLDIILILDDFEKASQDLIDRFADLTKLLTDTFRAPSSRVIFVGTHDIYRRLRSSDEALNGRLEQVSIGTFEHRGYSWAYLTKGFDHLGFYYPGKKSRFPEKGVDHDDLIRSVYESANGLLKSLSDLGKEISLKASERRITSGVIYEESITLLKNSMKEYESEFPGFVEDIMKSPGKKALLKHLFQGGVGRIHNLDTFFYAEKIEEKEKSQIEAAYESLAEQRFLVKIGFKSTERTFYITDPRFAHIFGVLCTHPKKYNISDEICRMTGQLELPFYLTND